MIPNKIEDMQLDFNNPICIDCETFDPGLKTFGPGAVYHEADIVGVAIGDLKNQYYLPIKHSNHVNFDWDNVKRFLNDIIFNCIIGANVLYDLEILAVNGVNLNCCSFRDVQYAEPLIDEKAVSYSLDALAIKYLKERKLSSILVEAYTNCYSDITKSKEFTLDDVYKNLEKLPAEVVDEYACNDVRQTLLIHEAQYQPLKDAGLLNLYENIECRLIPILLKMRLQGVRIDFDKLKTLYSKYSDEKDLIEKKYPNLNLNSNDQVAPILKGRGLVINLTEKGNNSITNDWLEVQNDDFATELRRYKKIKKFLSTFIEGYIFKNMWDENGAKSKRLHTMFHPLRNDQYGTVSGRFSSSNPNLQNIPSRDDEFKVIRGVFLPDEDEDMLVIDRSQIEYRLLVNFAVGAGSSEARKAYFDDPKTDFHKLVMEMTGLTRKPAKIANFLLVYGGSITKLTKFLSDVKLARHTYFTYHGKLPFVQRTHKKYWSLASQNHEIRTIMNRRRQFDFRESYHGLNGFIQGSAADIMKIDMIELYDSGFYDHVGYPLLTVHDELVFSISREDREHYITEAKDILESGYKKYVDDITVPLLVNCSIGPNWAECEEI